MTNDDLVTLLRQGAKTDATLARVLRHVEDKPICPRPEDFLAALKYDPAVVVRLSEPLPEDSTVAIDCRYRDGNVEYTHEYRNRGDADREAFLYDVRDADRVEVRHHRNSQFGEGWTCPDCRKESFDPDSRFIESSNEVRVTCPDCGAVEHVPQSSSPPLDREYHDGEEGVA